MILQIFISGMYDIEQPGENRIVGNSVLSQRIGSPHNNRYSQVVLISRCPGRSLFAMLFCEHA